jgi:hypothetical protein
MTHLTFWRAKPAVLYFLPREGFYFHYTGRDGKQTFRVARKCLLILNQYFPSERLPRKDTGQAAVTQ